MASHLVDGGQLDINAALRLRPRSLWLLMTLHMAQRPYANGVRWYSYLERL